jgi:hypothetical protein
VIALSIVAVALDNLHRHHGNSVTDYRLRISLAFGFGIFHGFGFE